MNMGVDALSSAAPAKTATQNRSRSSKSSAEALFQQSVQLFVKRMRYRPRQVCLCDPNRLLSSLPRFSAHCHARSLLPTVVNHSTIYDENPDLHHGLLGPAPEERRLK